MKPILASLAICLIALTACRKKQTVQSAPATPEQEAAIESDYILPTNAPARPRASPQPAQAARPAQPVVQAVNPAQQPIQERINGAIHGRLTFQLRLFAQKTGRMPQSFSEFISTTMDSAPLAPEGMKFVIDPADQTVKVVKK